MNLKQHKPLIFALGAGALGFCLRLALYRTGFDERNILSSSHPLHVACLVLTVLAAVYLTAAVHRRQAAGTPVELFPDSPLRSIAALAAACLMGGYALSLRRELGTLLEIARMALALGSAVSMALCALPRMPGKGIYGGLLAFISIFFAADMLCRYQGWSGNPQLPDYTLQVAASVLLALCSYHRLAFCTGLGKGWAMDLCGLMGLYLCIVCAAGPETPGFYLGGALWAFNCLCGIGPTEEETDVPA